MLKTIVVAIDDSEISERVLQALQDLQVQSETKIVLSYIIPTIGPIQERVANQLYDKEALPHLHVEKKLLAYQASLPIKSEIEIATGDPSEEIVRLANILHADLIIIGSRGLTGVQRIIQGSVSSQVVENATCSVLVVK